MTDTIISSNISNLTLNHKMVLFGKDGTDTKIDISRMFKNEDEVYIEVTYITKVYGKRFRDWTKLQDTQEYIRELEGVLKGHICDHSDNSNSKNKSPLIKRKAGRYGGVYLHQNLIIKYFTWIGIPYHDIIKLDFIDDEIINTHHKINSLIKKTQTQSKGIYIISDSRAYKIGIVTNIKQRVSSLQVGNPYELKVIHFSFINKPKTIESLLHNLFSKKQLMGEWFELSKRDIKRAIEIIKENEV